MRNAAKNVLIVPTMNFVSSAVFVVNVQVERDIFAITVSSVKTVQRLCATAVEDVLHVRLFVPIAAKNAPTAPTEKCARNAANALTVPDLTVSVQPAVSARTAV